MILAGILVMGAFAMTPGGGTGGANLGIWHNFPTTTQCTLSLDSCELFGTNIWRGIAFTGSASNTAVGWGLLVDCITPSNTPGAFLQLQVSTTALGSMANATNWVSFNNPVFIDNAVHSGTLFPCPGQLSAIFTTSIPLLNTFLPSDHMLFRAIGNGGGGAGDNPRFGTISVQAYQQQFRLGYPIVVSTTTTSFTAREVLIYSPTSAPFTLSFNWFATNVTTLQCVIAGQHCFESGTSSCVIPVLPSQPTCTVVVTFASAFVGVPKVTMTNTVTGGFSAGTIAFASEILFSASQ